MKTTLGILWLIAIATAGVAQSGGGYDLLLCETGQVELVSSDTLRYEVGQNPLPARKEYARAVLRLARMHGPLSDELKERARHLTEMGFKPLDALHLASAETAQVEYSCTCDDRLLRRARRTAGWKMKVVSPLELVQEIEP
jgi:hypothetical protein